MQTSSQIEALDAEASGTRVVFEWCGDRFRHLIYGIHLGEAFLLAESVEGNSIDLWPPSPPLQQLHKQPHPNGCEMLLLTGMAGKSHWSGSITTSVDLRWMRLGFAFACRHRNPPDWLGATYRIADGIHAERSPSGSGVLLQVGESLKYELYPSAIGTNLATENILTSSTELAGNTIQIAAKAMPHITTATTNQWAYELQLSRPYWITKRPPKSN